MDYTGKEEPAIFNDNELIDIVRFRLSKNRFQHSLQVARVAKEMAERFGIDPDKAYRAGILHDYAKGIASQELIAIAQANNMALGEVDELVPDLLHAPVGAFLLEKELGITDGEILAAVSNHTLGSPSMGDLDKIIFLADMIEPGRDFPGIERLSCLALRNLDEGMLFALEVTIKYCLQEKRILHPRTIETRNCFLLKMR